MNHILFSISQNPKIGQGLIDCILGLSEILSILLVLSPPQIISHELGHSISISLLADKTSYTKEKEQLITVILFGRTESTFFEYLSKNRHNKDIQKIIQISAISGLLANIMLIPFIFLISRIPIYIFKQNLVSYDNIVLIGILVWIIASISGIKNDYKNILNPEEYVYSFPSSFPKVRLTFKTKIKKHIK